MAMVHVIGTGMGDGLISDRAHELIRDADVLVGGDRLLWRFPNSRARRMTIKGPLVEMLQEVRQIVDGGERVVVLADGDPLFFGIGRHLLKVFKSQELEFYPNVTALQAAASMIGLPWDKVKTVSIHGRADMWPLLRAITFHDLVGIYTGGEDGPSLVAKLLRSRGANAFQLIVFENLGYKDQQIREFGLHEVEGQSFSPLNFVLLKRIKSPIVRLRLGIEDDEYLHERGLITKKEVRAMALASLCVLEDHTVWDLGAGCGSVAIEAACLARRGKVFAVERHDGRVRMIRENIKRTGAFHVEVVHGPMPGCLDSLPNPHSVFVGGGLVDDGGSLLEAAVSKLKPGGRIVIHTVLMSSLEKSLALFRRLGWDHGMVQAQVCRSTPLSGSLRLEALNPVFVISAQRPLEPE